MSSKNSAKNKKDDSKERDANVTDGFGGIAPQVWRVLAVVSLGPFMSQIDATVVNVSLSTIQQELHATVSATQWIISGYLLALALVLPLNGWLVEKIGTKKLYLICFSAFSAASLLCGLTRTMNELIAARIFQGITGGLLLPMTALMIARAAGKQRARAMGYAAVPVLVAPVLGPVAAAVILQYADWTWLFFVNVPIGVAATALAFFLLPADEPVNQKESFDFTGFLLISPGLVCLLYGLDQASRGKDYIFLLLGAFLAGAFVWHALRKKGDALVDLRLFKNSNFSIATGNQFFYNGMAFAGQFLIPLYLTTGCGLSATETGWLIAPMGIGMICTNPFMGFLTEKFGCRAVSVSGVLLSILGTLPFFWMIENELSRVLLIICLLVRGAGQGATGIPSMSAAYASVQKEQLSNATTAINIAQRLGGPIATTVIAIVISLAATYFPSSRPGAFMLPFAALLVIQLLVLLSSSRLPWKMPEDSGENVQNV